MAGSSREASLQSLYEGLLEKNPNWKLVVKSNEDPSHLIFCDACSKCWELIKIQPNKSIRSNSTTNLQHNCAPNKPLKITDIVKNELSQTQRETISIKYAEILGKHPTVSLNSGVEILNAVSNFVSQLTIDSRKNLNINLSRKHVSASMKTIGIEKLKKNREVFQNNYRRSSIIIDNWTGHGKNFLGILARTTVDDNKVHEYILDFKVLIF